MTTSAGDTCALGWACDGWELTLISLTFVCLYGVALWRILCISNAPARHGFMQLAKVLSHKNRGFRAAHGMALQLAEH